MRSRASIVFGLLTAAFATLAWWLRPTSHLPPPGSLSRPSSVNSSPGKSLPIQPSSEALGSGTVASKPPPAWADKTVAMKAIWAGENAKTQDFYGTVVDQYGRPVTDAEVIGNLAWIQGFDVPEKTKILKAKSDTDGQFQFTDIQGWELGVMPSKPGYELAPNTSARKLPPDGKTSPSGRALFTMWKLKGAEPMVHKEIAAALACDGSPTTLDLLTGRRVASGGDFTVSMIRNPLNIDRSGSFDWSVTFTVNGGGLMEVSDLYPNEAPAEGYHPSITKNTRTGPPYFTGNAFDKSYYIKSRGGQVYGRMKVHISADYQPPPVRLEIEVFANPNASRNLEYDRFKQAPNP